MVPVLFGLLCVYCFNDTSAIADSSSSLCWLQGTGRLTHARAGLRQSLGSTCGSATQHDRSQLYSMIVCL